MARFVRTYWSALLLALVGLILMITAVLSATVFRPAAFINASLPVEGQSVIVTSKANALNLLADKVKIDASSDPEANVTVAIGRGTDVDQWVDGRPHTEISGLASWTKLSYNTVNAPADAKPLAEQDLVAGSDMWLAQKTGKGSAELEWTQREYPTSLVVFADGKAKVQVTLQWHREVSTPLLWPFLIIGILLVAAGAIVFYILFRLHQHQPEVKKAPVAPQLSPSELVGEPGSRRPSRRALRQAREAGEETLVVDGKEFPTGMIPKITVPEPAAETSEEESAEASQPVDGETAASEAEAPVSAEVSDGDVEPDVTGDSTEGEAHAEAETHTENGEAESEPSESETEAFVSETQSEDGPSHYLFRGMGQESDVTAPWEEETEGQASQEQTTEAKAEENATPDEAEAKASENEKSPEEVANYEDLAAKWMNTVRKWND